MSWEGSTRRERLPDDWEERRKFVIRRAGGICEKIKTSTGRRCTNSGRDVDHIIRGDDHEPTNLQLLCVWHHREKTAAEGNEAQAVKRSAARRPPERHPGRRG